MYHWETFVNSLQKDQHFGVTVRIMETGENNMTELFKKEDGLFSIRSGEIWIPRSAIP